MEKLKIEKNTVQETLLVPLYGRKMCSEKFPVFLQRDYATDWIMIFRNWRKRVIHYCMNSVLLRLR